MLSKVEDQPERPPNTDLRVDDSDCWPNAENGSNEEIDGEDVTSAGEPSRSVKSGKVVSVAGGCVVGLSAFEAVPTTRGSNSVNSESRNDASSTAPVLETPSAFCCCPATSSVTAVFVFVFAAVAAAGAVASSSSFEGVVCVVVSFGGGGGGTT
jgi:hypothetical protein